MKIYNISISLLIGLVICMTGCDIDNYDEPDSTFCGKFVTKNGDPVYQRVQATTSLKLNLYETKRENSLPQQFYTKLDGTFENSMLFGNEYEVILEQTNFLPIEDRTIFVKGRTEEIYEVVPFCEVKSATAIKIPGDSIQVKFSLSREKDTDCKITGYAIYWNASPYVDDQSVNKKGEIPVSTPQPDTGLLAPGKVFEEECDITSLVEEFGHIIKNNNYQVYVRIAVTTSYKGNSFINFSDVLPVKLN
ncbi:MAG: DUF3823 domain-containing protein [Tannerellaceae bacterium]|nr:DUF3823 domain-containing protein [Tannerellaceae bacterium]